MNDTFLVGIILRITANLWFRRRNVSEDLYSGLLEQLCRGFISRTMLEYGYMRLVDLHLVAQIVDHSLDTTLDNLDCARQARTSGP
jgi:hypothetical protein